MSRSTSPHYDQIIGVDCAVDPQRVGLAASRYSGGKLLEVEVLLPHGRAELVAWIERRIRRAKATLLAMDSPLGWPAPLGQALGGHRAGGPIAQSPDELFRRLTDRVVRERIGKQPLEVGADRIARTAVAALQLLETLGRSLGRRVELAWDPQEAAPVAAIETYPAAWLLSRDLPARRYKNTDGESAERRTQIIAHIERLVASDLSADTRGLLQANSHALDALICVLCGVDFCRGLCLFPSPAERERAQKEGWIWFRNPETAGPEGRSEAPQGAGPNRRRQARA